MLSTAPAGRALALPVLLTDGTPATLAATYYPVPDAPPDRPLQVCIPGATYTQTYWNLPPLDGAAPSYVGQMLAAGYPVLTLDPLGSGVSSHPPGDAVTLTEVVSTLGQALAALRSPATPLGRPVERLVLVGHSLGSLLAIQVQAVTGLAAGLVLTSFAHTAPSEDFTQLLAEDFDATQPYLRFPPRLRHTLFYDAAGDSITAVQAYDDAHFDDPEPRGLFATVMGAFFDPTGQQSGAAHVAGPVLVQLGEYDPLFPARLAATEPAAWPHAQVTVQTLPLGHSFQLHRAGDQSAAGILTWLPQI